MKRLRDVGEVPIGDMRGSSTDTSIPHIAMPVEEQSTASKDAMKPKDADIVTSQFWWEMQLILSLSYCRYCFFGIGGGV